MCLAVTGAEALYADLGHFGRRPDPRRLARLVFPSLMLNYLGQGALVLSDPERDREPVLPLAPGWALLPLVILATARDRSSPSQANITGAFSLTRQAVQLGLLPRLEIRHTSEAHSGQIYLPQRQRALHARRRDRWCFCLQVLERHRHRLRHRRDRHDGDHRHCWPSSSSAGLGLEHRRRRPLIICRSCLIELRFLSANLLKIFDGGYVPLLLAGGLVLIMGTWVQGHAHPVREDPQDRRAAGWS